MENPSNRLGRKIGVAMGLEVVRRFGVSRASQSTIISAVRLYYALPNARRPGPVGFWRTGTSLATP
jgi:hypothetical protein